MRTTKETKISSLSYELISIHCDKCKKIIWENGKELVPNYIYDIWINRNSTLSAFKGDVCEECEKEIEKFIRGEII